MAIRIKQFYVFTYRTGLVILASNIASGSISLVKMEREHDAFPVA